MLVKQTSRARKVSMEHLTIPRSESHPVTTYPYRRWCMQAARLYPSDPRRQQQAIVEHVHIILAETTSVNRWLWCQDLLQRIEEALP